MFPGTQVLNDKYMSWMMKTLTDSQMDTYCIFLNDVLNSDPTKLYADLAAEIQTCHCHPNWSSQLMLAGMNQELSL